MRRRNILNSLGVGLGRTSENAPAHDDDDDELCEQADQSGPMSQGSTVATPSPTETAETTEPTETTETTEPTETTETTGCGVRIEGVRSNVRIGCGMGHVPARSQRFLSFLIDAGDA